MNTKISDAAVEAAIKAHENAIVSPAMVTNGDFMRAALEAALPHLASDALPVGGWEPIQTAPKSVADGRAVDGVYLLGFVPEDDLVDLKAGIRIIWWEPLLCSRHGQRGMWVSDATDASIEVSPTHWMPLPEAPVTHPQAAALDEVSGTSGELGGDERARFEAWAAREGYDVEKSTGAGLLHAGEYLSDRTDEALKVWQAALATTGKQQGGEVQGDALEAEARRLFQAQADKLAAPWERQWEPTKKHWRAAALAARQPVRQEAVVTYCGRRLTPEGTRECWGVLAEGVEDLPRNTKLYAAPPVQGIDLGQQEDAERYRWLRDQYDPSVHDDEDGSFLRLAGEELDAAIDGERDAARGVARG